jgi:nucleoside-diphosphate-sugar epimerase
MNLEGPSHKRVLMTGAGGFVGRHALEPLRRRGYQIHGILAPEESVPSGADFVDWLRVDLLNTAEARQLVLEIRPSHLLNLAWYVAPGSSYGALQNFRWLQTGVELLLAFVESGGGRVVNVGSCAEYDWSHGILSENTPLHPDSHYGLAKKALSEVQTAILDTTEVSGAWARPFLIYGPHENPKRFVSAVITALLRGEPAECTDGLHKRDFLHVQDVADALVAILDSDISGPVNVGSGQAYRLCDIATRIAELMGNPELLRLGALPHARPEAPLVQADIARIQNELGWTPRFDLDAGLRDTVAWWKAHLEPAARKA